MTIFYMTLLFIEWVTPDLVSSLKSNDVLSRGFENPKCMYAIQLMQKDAKAAMAQFQKDAEVSAFLKEFGTVMAAHFNSMAPTNKSSNTGPGIVEVSAPSNVSSSIADIGPLHAKVIENQKEGKRQETLTLLCINIV